MITAAFAAATAVCLTPPELFAESAAAYRSVAHPSFPAGAASEAGLVPPGWKVETRLAGDVDGDGRSDLVLLIKGADRGCLVAEQDIYGSRLDTNPRAVVVALAGPGGYRVAASNDSLIPRHLAPQVEDPLENGGVTLENGALKVSVHYWSSMGSWSIAHRDFTFRWRGGRLVLVGFDVLDARRNTGETEERSYNYLSGRLKTSLGAFDEDRPKSIRWSTLRKAPLRAFADLGDAWEFEP